jgi:hypothetical protein
MRTLILAAAFACSLLTPAQAQNRAPTSAQLRDFVGQYNLEDGRVLTVSLPGRALVAQVTGQDAVVLQPAGARDELRRTGVLRVAFDQHANGVVTGVTVDTTR